MKMASQDKKVENITKNLHHITHVVTLIIISLASLVKIKFLLTCPVGGAHGQYTSYVSGATL